MLRLLLVLAPVGIGTDALLYNEAYTQRTWRELAAHVEKREANLAGMLGSLRRYERWCMKLLVRSAAVVLSLIGAVAVATAQTTGTPVETAPVPLPPEKQAIVKEHVRRNNVPAANLDGPVTVGVTLPETVELFALPQDTVTEVPTVTRYKFLSTSNVIAVVDPETRKVIQIIQN